MLKRIVAVRTRNPEGKGASFSGWELNNTLPLLHSMLEFPPVARDIDHANLIWKAVAHDPEELTRVVLTLQPSTVGMFNLPLVSP